MNDCFYKAPKNLCSITLLDLLHDPRRLLLAKVVKHEWLGLNGLTWIFDMRPPPSESEVKPVNDVYIGEALPNGFLERTAETGKVIGWTPQVEILGHSATGGLLSHSGWNSTLESVWHDVPMITWSMFAKQQLNAFEITVELRLAMKMVINYHVENPRLVKAKEIESGIRRLIEDDAEIREKIKAKSKESRTSVMERGSSLISLGHFSVRFA